ncbi:hypothetical protein QBC47DRAFT_151900 [Echria macrotheca]|uniref:Uncharacterized protein n=1 Tax=Echria macrotheca TaxID=438768 RepID=A0AAJ0EZU2_9PEZI|nr:hypothetical protein QBC47DRAFT_151900 [Echria macrotheca]
MMPTWFLPPDFTFTPAKLPLGLVISHPKNPSDIIAFPSSLSAALPAESSLIEPNHSHSVELSTSVGLSLLARLLDLVSGSANVTKSRRDVVEYGQVDHHVRTFETPLSDAAIRAIVALPKVRDYIRGSLFGRRPVYIVCGLRVATTSFRVETVRESTFAADVGAEVPIPAGTVPVEVGGRLSGCKERVRMHSYETAPGIVFAYQLCAIKFKGNGREGSQGRLFESRDAFMTGDGGGTVDELELVDVTEEVLDEDYDLPVECKVESVGDGNSCVLFIERA